MDKSRATKDICPAIAWLSHADLLAAPTSRPLACCSRMPSDTSAPFEQPAFWDERYEADADYIYGRRPNATFAQLLDAQPPCRLLLVAEGEGRNAVYAAERGWTVTATDFSAGARDKALALAAERGVTIDYQLADATAYATDERFDAVTLVFLHLGPQQRAATFRRYADLLAPGGRLIVFLYHPDQLGRASGGPKSVEWLVGDDELAYTFTGVLRTETLTRREVELDEGPLHRGPAVVTLYVGVN